MRLRRSFLLLAAGLAASPGASAANIYVDAASGGAVTATTATYLGTNDFFIGDADLTINLTNGLGAPISATFTGHFKQGATVGGRLIKSGGGTLQYDGFNDNEVTYFHNHTFSILGGPPFPTPTDIRASSLNGFSGTVVVQQGQLQVSGAINQWGDYGPLAAQVGVAGAGMLGAEQVILASGTTLSFQNTQLNLVNAMANLTGTQPNVPSTPLIARLNFVNNVQGAADSQVYVGKTTDYILVAHSDFAARGLGAGESSIGVLAGRGRFYKTGGDGLVIRGNSTFDGEVVLGAGATTLASANRDSLYSATSVNLASVGAAQGSNTYWRPYGGEDAQFWKPGYAPGAGTASLVVSGSQRIRNFQSLFGEAGIYQPILPGTGTGTTVSIAAASDLLQITQETGFDGYYTGSFLGAGTLVKDGAGTLALRLDANNLPRVDINAGKLIANVQSLGSGVINIAASAQLSIFQNDAGALRAEVRATSALAELRFKPSDSIYYRGSNAATTVGNTDAGVADIVRNQALFYGKVIAEDGTAVVFSAGNNNAFANASSIQLLNGPSGRETSIRFNDTNQIVNNLSGDAYTRIFLGRGNITLGITSASTYDGGIEGVGNLVKNGSAGFTLAGANTYFGATIVQQGSLRSGSANGIRNTSGVILAGTGTVFSGEGAQSIGSLFGRSGTTVNIGGSLTVGISSDLRSRLDQELLNLPVTVQPVDKAYYLATETTDSVTGFSPVTTLTLLVQKYNLNDTLTADGVTDADEALAYLDSVTVDGAVDADEVLAHRDLLGFAGTLNLGSGGLTKVGIERLILSGTANYTGLTDVQGGTLEVGIDTLKGTSGIQIGRDGTFAIDLAANRSYTAPLTGSGTFQKLGAGRLDLNAAASAFTGVYRVSEGTLAVAFSPTTVGGTTTTQGSVNLAALDPLAPVTFIAKVANNLEWTGQVYGAGTFVKTGAGILTLTAGYIFHDGLTDVQQGGIVARALTAGDLNLAAGTSFVDDVADNPDTAIDDYFTYDITGTGAFTKAGLGDLRIESAQSFAGTLTVAAGSLTLVAADAFGAAQSIVLQDGATLVLANGGAQSLGNLSASAGSNITVELAGTDLTLDVATGTTRNFLGQILGDPDLIKTGAGKLFLDRPSASANEIATISVQAGELEGSQAGFGGASIDIASGATLRFFADTGATEAYTVAITGTGTVAKSGAGTVDLSAASLTAVSTTIDVAAGTLIVSETALGAGRAPVVTLAAGTTFEYQATNDATFGVGNFSGAGSVTFGRTGTDTPVLTLTPNGSGTTGYTGLTTVRDGVTLRLGAGFTSLAGIDAESGSTLDLSLISALTITQTVDGAFAGNLVGTADLTLAGTARLSIDSNGGTLNGYAGSVTVNGATLALDLDNTKAVALANGGTLSLRGTADNYTGAITGSGAVILEDGTDVDLTVGGNAASTTLGSAAITQLSLADGSHLTASLTTGAPLAGKSIQLNGGLLTAYGSGAVTLSLAAPTATAAPTGDAGLELLGTADYSVSGRLLGDLSVGTTAAATFLGAAKTGATPPADITGDIGIDGSLRLGAAGAPVTVAGSVTVFADGTLSGAWTVGGALANGGMLAPGFSPAHVTVGSLDNTGTLQMELSADSEDQIAFTGSATLNRDGASRLEVNRYGAGNSYGVRHVILKDNDTTVGDSFISAAAEDPRFATVVSVGTSTTALRHLLVYPTQLQGGLDGILGNTDDAADPLRSLAVDGEVAVYQVRARAEYTHATAPANVIGWIRDITEVELTETSPGEWTSTLGAGFTALGARFATLGDARLSQAVDNLTANAQYSLATVAVAGARADQDAVARRLEQTRFDKAGISVKGDQWYVDAIGGRTDVDAGPSATIGGATAGFIRDVGFDGYFGASLGVDKSKGRNGFASVDTSGFRLGLFGGFLTDDRTLAFDAGLSFASLSGDLAHPSVFGTPNGGSADARTTSGWVRASTAVALDGTWSLTPFAQFEASSTQLSSLSETGSADALTVEDATLSESTLSLGLGIQSSWTDGSGDWRYRLSLDISYFAQLSGDTLSLTSGIPDEGLALYSAERRVLPGSGVSLAPTFNFGPDPDSTITLGMRFDQSSDGSATGWQVGYRKRF